MKHKLIVAILVSLLMAYNLYIDVSPLFDRGQTGFTLTFYTYFTVLGWGIGGTVQYWVTRFQRSGWLRGWLLYSFFINFGLFFFTILFVLTNKREMHFNPFINRVAIVSGIVSAVSLYSLIILQKAVQARFQAFVLDGEAIYQFHPAPRWKRFLNRLLDLVFIIAAFSAIFGWINTLRLSIDSYGGGYALAEEIVLLALIAIGILLYYFILEAAFSITFGKLVTGTLVVDEAGAKPSTKQALMRTICRLIPFEPFSFISSERGWHDSYSNTYVTNSKYDWQPHDEAA